MFSFFFTDTATTEIYTLSLHDALPISERPGQHVGAPARYHRDLGPTVTDRKSTRLNSSHSSISYAVFCLKKKTYPERRSTSSLPRSAITICRPPPPARSRARPR